MAWIKSHSELMEHPKTKLAARLLKISKITMIGHLHALWYWALKYAPDGIISVYPKDFITDEVEWEGDPEAFFNALINCGAKDCPGLIDVLDDGSLAIHDWDEHCGHEYERRLKDAERKRAYREQKKQGQNSSVPVASMGRPPDATGMSAVEKEIEKDLTSPSESEVVASPPNVDANITVQDVPAAMRETVDYFLLKTGRKGLMPIELSAVRELEKNHVPARVNQEIVKAIERYERKEKPLAELTLDYIHKSLQYQKSRKPKTQPPKQQANAWPYSFAYEDLAALWDKYMPNAGFMRAPEPTQKWRQCLADRILENPSARNSLDWWLDRFREIDASDKASAREPVNDDGLLWRLELSKLLESEDRLQKLMTGAYRNRQAGPMFVEIPDEECEAHGW